MWILGGRRRALDKRQSPLSYLEESALTGNLKFTFKWFISFNSFTEAVHSLKCVRKTRVRFFLYQHHRHISGRETRPHHHLTTPSSRCTSTPAHPGLEKDHSDGTETSLCVYCLYEKKESSSNYITSRYISIYQAFLKSHQK